MSSEKPAKRMRKDQRLPVSSATKEGLVVFLRMMMFIGDHNLFTGDPVMLLKNNPIFPRGWIIERSCVQQSFQTINLNPEVGLINHIQHYQIEILEQS